MGTLKKLMSSRKFVVMLLGMIAAIGARLGLPEETAAEVATSIVVLASVFCGAQGLADFSKEKLNGEAEDVGANGG